MFAERQNMLRHPNSRNCSMEVKVGNQRQKDYKAEVLLYFWQFTHSHTHLV